MSIPGSKKPTTSTPRPFQRLTSRPSIHTREALATFDKTNCSISPILNHSEKISKMSKRSNCNLRYRDTAKQGEKVKPLNTNKCKEKKYENEEKDSNDEISEDTNEELTDHQSFLLRVQPESNSLSNANNTNKNESSAKIEQNSSNDEISEDTDEELTDDQNFQSSLRSESHYSLNAKNTNENKFLAKIYSNGYNLVFLLFIVAFIAGLLRNFNVFSGKLENKNESPNLEELIKKFPSQSEEFWDALYIGLNESRHSQKPITLMLLYDETSEKTLNHLLKEVGKYSCCFLRGCSISPIILTEKELNSNIYKEDYGILINEYKNKMMEQGVMIVKNLENISGLVAQAFHSFCDEYSPLVPVALYIFTVKFDQIPSNLMSAIEHLFENKWSDINADTYYALISRITNMPVKISPEQ